MLSKQVVWNFVFANEISCADVLKAWRFCSAAYEWYKDFKSRLILIEDLPRSGRPATSNSDENVKKVKEMMLEIQHTSLRKIVSGLGVGYETTRHIRRKDDCWVFLIHKTHNYWWSNLGLLVSRDNNCSSGASKTSGSQKKTECDERAEGYFLVIEYHSLFDCKEKSNYVVTLVCFFIT